VGPAMPDLERGMMPAAKGEHGRRSKAVKQLSAGTVAPA